MPKLFLSLMLLFSASAFASFEISEKRIYFFSRDSSSGLTIVNSGTTTQEYILSAQPWGDQATSQAAAMVAYPPVFTLAPGENQRVRLLLRDKQTLKPPLYFRLRLREQLLNQTLSASQLPTVFSFPVYYVDHREVASIRLALAYDSRSGKPIKAMVNNNSNTVAHIKAVRNGRNEIIPLDIVLRSEETYDFLIGDTPLPLSFQLKDGRWFSELEQATKRSAP
jgi:P pilus assembly chaperone PapD